MLMAVHSIGRCLVNSTNMFTAAREFLYNFTIAAFTGVLELMDLLKTMRISDMMLRNQTPTPDKILAESPLKAAS